MDNLINKGLFTVLISYILISLTALSPAASAQTDHSIAEHDAVMKKAEINCAQKDDAESCNHIAEDYMMGQWIEKDLVKSRALFKKSCDLGWSAGCYNLAVMQRDAIGGTDDITAAMGHFKVLCALKDYKSCFNLGALHGLHPKSPSKDILLIKAYSLKACQGGHSNGCNTYAAMLRDHATGPEDMYESLTLFNKMCQKDLGVACYNVADMASTTKVEGLGYDRALFYYNRACELDYIQACLIAGTDYYLGTKIEKDASKAYALYKKACDLNSPQGCYNQAALMRAGDGIEADPATAKEMIVKSCAAGHAKSCTKIDIWD